MLQPIGALFLIGASFYLGYHFSVMEGRRVRQSEGFVLLLRHIRAGIVCYASPLGEIYAGFENRALEICGFLPALRAGGFAHALRLCRDRLYIEGEELCCLAAFAGQVGQGYTAEQAGLCDYTIAVMERALQRRQEEAPRRARAARSLTVCGGLMLLLLLL